MAKYYNKMRGPLSVSLRDGSPLVCLPKRWSEDIPLEKEGSASLQRAVRKGHLVRQIVVPAPVVKSSPPPPKAKAKAVPKAAPKKAAKSTKKGSKKKSRAKKS